MRHWMIGVVFMSGAFAWGNTLKTPPSPISHCYHWLKSAKGFLEAKYKYARENDGEMTFFTTPATTNGAYAGPGLYCAKSPSQSSEYGDRVVRIDFVDDVVLMDNFQRKKFCGHRGDAIPEAECQQKTADVTYYLRSPDYYVIQNPGAVASWSSMSDQVIQDLSDEIPFAGSTYKAQVETAAKAMREEAAKAETVTYYNHRARLSMEEILAKDAKRILLIPVVSVLGGLKTVRADKVTSELVEWATLTSVLRVFRDDSVEWRDVRSVLANNALLRKTIVRVLSENFPPSTADQKPFSNFEVIVMAANAVIEDLPAPTREMIVAESLKRPFAAHEDRESLKPVLKEIFARHIQGWMEDVGRRQSPTDRARVYNFLTVQSFDSDLQRQVKNWIFSLVPSAARSHLFLAQEGSTFPAGSEGKDFEGLCQAQVMMNDLYDKDLELATADRHYLKMGKIARGENLADFCSRAFPVAQQLLALKGKPSSEISVVQGTIQKVPYYFVVDSAESLQGAAEEYMRKSATAAAAEEIIVSVNGSSQTKIVKGYSAWPSGDFVKALLRSARDGGVLPMALADYQRTALARKAEYTITGSARLAGVTQPKFMFSVASLEEFGRDCKTMGLLSSLGEVDYVMLALNGKDIATYSPPSDAGKGIEANCRGLQRKLSPFVPSEAAQAVQKIAAQAAFRATVWTDTLNFRNTFAGNSPAEIAQQCPGLFAGVGVAEASQLGVTLPDGSNKYWNVPNKWVGTDEICKALVERLSPYIPSQAQQEILKKPAPYRFSVKIEERFTRTFIVSSKEEASAQCRRLILDEDLKGLRYLSLVQSGSTRSLYSISGNNWTGASEACAAVVTAIDAAVPREAQERILSLPGKIRFTVEIPYGGKRTFVVDGKEEIASQCRDLIKGEDVQGKNAIYLSAPGVSRTTIYASNFAKGNYWESADQVCAGVAAGADPFVSRKEQGKVLGLPGKVRLEARIDQRGSRTFVVDSKADLTEQCPSLIKDEDVQRVRRITMVRDGRAYKNLSSDFQGGPETWRDAAQACKAIVDTADLP